MDIIMAIRGKNKLATVNKTQPTKKTPEIKSGSSIRDVVEKTTAAPQKTKVKATDKKPVGSGSSLALKPTTSTETTEAPTKSIAQQLMDLESTQRAAIEKKKEEQAKELGRSKDASRRVSSATRISGLRGLEPRLGMQFYKK